mgnify:CR=1 FL=1
MLTSKEFYIFKIWYITILISPIFYIVWIVIDQRDFDISILIQLYILCVTFGALFSTPVTLILYFLNKTISRKTKPFYKNLYLSIYIIFGVFITFYLIFNQSVDNNITLILLPLTYSIVMVFSLLYYKSKYQNL